MDTLPSPERFTPKDNVLVISAKSEKGKRAENQDAVKFGDDWGVVADGDNGSANPAKASNGVAYKMGLGLAAINKKTHVDDVTKVMGSLFTEANGQAIAEDGMTTVAAVKVVGDKFGRRYGVIASVGDSRAYLIREGKIRQITTDDLDENNKLTSSIGRKGQEVKVHTHVVSLDLGDKLILATKGVHQILTEEELTEIALKGGAEDIVAAAGDRVENWVPKRYNEDRTAFVISLERPARPDSFSEALDVVAQMEEARQRLRRASDFEQFWDALGKHLPDGRYLDSKGVERTIPYMREKVMRMVEMVRKRQPKSDIQNELNQLTTDPDIRLGLLSLLANEEREEQ